MSLISRKIKANNTSNRFVVGDIHGCFLTFKALLDKIQLSKKDQLFLLGDYVDRGPHSQEVLDFIIELLESGYQVYPLMGNHEADLIAYIDEEPQYLLWHLKKNKYAGILENGSVKKKYIDFLNSLPYYYDTEDFYLVHAGFNFKKDRPFEEKKDMLELRRMEPDDSKLNGRRIIHGHQPVYMDEIIQKVDNRNVTIPLDNGVPYIKPHKVYDHTKLGSLCCLNLDTFELINQENIEFNA